MLGGAPALNLLQGLSPSSGIDLFGGLTRTLSRLGLTRALDCFGLTRALWISALMPLLGFVLAMFLPEPRSR